MSNLTKSMICFAFLYNTVALSSLPAQSNVPSNFINDYCTNAPYYYRNQPAWRCLITLFAPEKPLESVFVRGLTLPDEIVAIKNGKPSGNKRVRGSFDSRGPANAIFLPDTFPENTSDQETCFYYPEKNRHTLLAEIDMTTFWAKR